MLTSADTIKEGWQKLKLGEILNLNYGKGLPQRHRISGDFPVYGSGGIVGTHNEPLIKAPGIIIGRKGSIGEVYYSNKDFYPIDTVYYIEAQKDNYDLRFIYFLLKNLDLKSLNSDAAVPGLNRTIAHFQDVYLPKSVEKQKKISDFLSAYDDLIEVNQKKIKVLENIAQSIYKEWFVKPVQNGIPEGWEVKTIGDKINIKKGKNITKSTITTGDIPVVAGGLNPAYYHNQANTISPVVTISASGANSGFVKLYNRDIWASDCSYIDKNITPFVYFYYLFLQNNQIEITRMQRGAAQPHVYPVDLMRLSIIDPGDDLIKKIEEEIAPIFKDISNIEKQNQNLQKTRDILIPQLVGGKISLK